jgi:hypothetical protein
VSSLAPRSLLAAQAIDHTGDPQLAAGVHLRVLPSEQLGLPVAPLLVYRLNLGQGAQAAQLRTDITWRDSRGQTLAVPFAVSPENPVTGYLPPPASGICCWIEVLAKPTVGISELPLSGRRELASRVGFGQGLQVTALVSTPLGDAPIARVSRPAYQLAASRIERVVVTGRGVVEGVRWVDARSLTVTAGDLWRALALPIGSGARYAGIPQAAARAKDRVARGAPLREPLYEAAAAIDAGSTPTATASDETSRVLARTPDVEAWLDLLVNDLSQPPQDLTTAPEPLLDADGVARGTVSLHALGATLAAALDPGVGRWLGLVDLDDDLAGASPGDVIAYVIRGVWRSRLARTPVAGTPGAATHVTARTAASYGGDKGRVECVGFADLKPRTKLAVPLVRGGIAFRSLDRSSLRIADSLPVGAPDGVSELQGGESGIGVTLPYAVDAVEVTAGSLPQGRFAVVAFDAAGKQVARVTATAAGQQSVTVGAAGIAELALVPGKGAKGIALVRVCIPGTPSLPPDDKDPLWDLLTVACATLDNPPDRPLPPVLGSPVSGAWLPAPAPTAIREIDTAASGLVPGALLAFARAEGAAITSLNPVDPSGRPLPLAAAPPASASAPGQGVLHDRAAPPEAVAYRAAQADWFGRWSGWAEVAAGPGTRPLPPRPSVTAFYVPAAFGDPVPTGTLTGTVRVRVPYPPRASLAPGANLLEHLEVTVDGVITNAPAPAGTPDDVEVSATGPALSRCEQRSIAVTARWVDTTGVASVPSDSVSVLCLDARPPAQTSLPNTLQYSSRPDVTGKARVTLQWGTSPDQRRFRVFYADERTLQSGLGLVIADTTDPRRSEAQALVAALTDGMSAPDRAAIYRAHASLFTREWWDQLTTTPIEVSGATADYEHALPGSLRLVAFYRVLAVSASNVDADFASSPMAAFGIPNTSPPAKPLLRVNLDPTAPAGQARLHVRVPPGPVAAASYRLRRSSTTSADALHMPISGAGAVPASAPGTLGQEFDVVDLGPTNATSAPLRNWVKYSWRVEVQGAAEPGGGPPGDWSQPSNPVSTALVPAGPPTAPVALAATAAGAGQVALSWQHPDSLLGGSVGTGGYVCEVYRRAPGAREQLAHTVPADASPADGGRAPDRTGSFSYTDPGPVAAGTSYRVAVVDPIGRRSAPSAEVTVS